MGKRSDFGKTWSDVVANWYLGVRPETGPEAGWNALGTLECLWPEYLDKVLAEGARGVGVMAPVVDRGLALAACCQLVGFNSVLSRMQQGNTAALSEAQFAAALVKAGYHPVLEPWLRGKRLDTVVFVHGQRVYVEVVCPELSDVMRQAYASMQTLAERLVNETVGTRVGVRILAEPDREVLDSVLSFVAAATPSLTKVVHQLGDMALVQYEVASPNLSPFQPAPLSPGVPTLFVESVRKQSGVVTRVHVDLPMSDERAERLVHTEARHFSRDQTNLLAMDVTKVPGGIRTWTPLIERRFQPTRNRRIGAVALFSSGLSVHRGALLRRWTVLCNPHALNPVPQSLLSDIVSLDESAQLGFSQGRH